MYSFGIVDLLKIIVCRPMEKHDMLVSQQDLQVDVAGFDIFDAIEEDNIDGPRQSTKENYAAFAVQGTGEVAQKSPVPSTPPRTSLRQPSPEEGYVVFKTSSAASTVLVHYRSLLVITINVPVMPI